MSQQLIQTAPPTDDYIPGPQTKPILVITEPSPSPLLAPLTPQTLALQQDSVTEEPTSPKPAEDRSLDSETPIRQVSPLLGTTPRENLQLRPYLLLLYHYTLSVPGYGNIILSKTQCP